MSSLQQRVDAVKSAISSTSTCTPSTVASLSELLVMETTKPLEGTSKTTVSSRKPLKTTTTIQGKARKTTAATAKHTQGKTPEKDICQLSHKERALLATEVINQTIKILDVAIKRPAEVKRQTSASQLKKSHARQTLRRSSSLPHSPHSPRRLERTASSSSIRPSRSSSVTSPDTVGQRCVAECSRLAFGCLRSMEAAKLPYVDLPPLRLENGMLALVGKLITLGLDDIATREIRILKRRLDTACEAPPKLHDQKSALVPLSLTDILIFTSPVKSEILPLAISTQINSLKLLVSSNKPQTFAAALSNLELDKDGSPVQLLMQMAKEGPIGLAKAVRQLETISLLVMSLTPSVSSSEDGAVLDSKHYATPEIALQLQSLAYQIRTTWWTLCDHRPEVQKEFMAPFSKCLSAFARRTQCDPKLSYTLAMSAVGAFESYMILPSPKGTTAKSTIYKALGSLAQVAGIFEDAARWIVLLKDILTESNCSDAQLCATTARLTTLKLHSSPHDECVESLLMGLLDGIQGPLRGNSQEVDELFLDITTTRKVAISVISKQRKCSNSKNSESLADGTRQLCESLILTCPRFVLRYLGKPPGQASDTKTVIAYEQRRKLVGRFIHPTIDSTLYLVKTLRSEGTLTWDLLESTLQDCLALLQAVPDDSLATTDANKPPPSYFVKISHLYYTQYLDFERDLEKTKDSLRLRALRRSIDCVKDRTAPEKATATLLSKLERLSNNLASVGRFDEAQQAAFDLRDELLGRGALHKIANMAASASLQVAWQQNDDTSNLARIMVSLVKFQLKLNLSSILDIAGQRDNMPVEEAGVWLEQVLEILAAQTKDVSAAVAIVSTELLSIYEVKQFPIRRLRVCTQLLSHGLQQQDLKNDVRNTVSAVSIKAIMHNSYDKGLCRYSCHLKSLALSAIELCEDHPRPDLLRGHLETWGTMLDDSDPTSVLSETVDDISKLLSHLQLLADFFGLTGSGTMRVAVLRMIALLIELDSKKAGPDDLITAYNDLGLQYLHLGYSGKAGIALDKAHLQSKQNGASIQGQLRYSLAYAEYLLAIGNIEKCDVVLCGAEEYAVQYLPNSGEPLQSKDKFEAFLLLANASMIYSSLSLKQGSLESALLYARRSVKLVYRVWDLAESQAKRRSNSSVAVETESLMSSKNTTDSSPPTGATITSSDERTVGPFFWSLVPLLYRALLWLSQLYAHNGMYQETFYYAEQAQKVASNGGVSAISASASAAIGELYLTAGNVERAAEQLNDAKTRLRSFPASLISVKISIHLGLLQSMVGKKHEDVSAFEEAQNALDGLMHANYIQNCDRIVSPAAILEAEMSKLAIVASKPRTTRKAPVGGKAVVKKATAKKQPIVETAASIQDECLGVRSMKGHLLRRQAESLLMFKRREEVLDLLRASDEMVCGSQDSIDQRIAFARSLLAQGMEQMAADPVYSVLHESTISMPSIMNGPRGNSTLVDKPSAHKASPPHKGQANARSKSPMGTGFCEKLSQAQDHLRDAYAQAAHNSSSTAVLHRISGLLNATTLLLSAAGSSRSKASPQPGFASYALEYSRNTAIEREISALTDGTLSGREEDLKWPQSETMRSTRPTNGLTSLTQELSKFQKDFIDIIPSAWTAISIALSENRQDLCVTKMQAGHSPFVLRLPLGRNNSRDVDEEVFDFEQGREELREIVTLANESAHGARTITEKGGKTAWWTERDTLDIRMKDLLENIERVWLGGFKGIFSQHTRQSNLLARFQRSFQNILDKHLPSRQKTGRKPKATQKVNLDPRILDLFIGLGDPCKPDADFDEPLTDLLYFVVDVLQFHGERNAYDEIDFDSIVVETHDALRCYHEVLQSSSASMTNHHTILILDKALHAFPWESLPCMDGLPISRMPSLGSLRALIIASQESIQLGQPEGHYVARSSGSYILNPSGDLKKTTSTLAPLLQPLSLPSGRTIADRAPTETEFANLLTESSYLLYFGHGSGTQYIRPKTIRRLASPPAVSFLMGCSSGALTECGEFEPYGTPINYILAGCPALVANLWDVTDRDCDRFAIGALDEWGLFNGAKEKKGKGKEKDTSSLVQAVAKARSECQYRYLTAAAVCVYGIPVYLK